MFRNIPLFSFSFQNICEWDFNTLQYSSISIQYFKNIPLFALVCPRLVDYDSHTQNIRRLSHKIFHYFLSTFSKENFEYSKNFICFCNLAPDILLHMLYPPGNTTKIYLAIQFTHFPWTWHTKY